MRKSKKRRSSSARGLRIVALFEAAKGVLVLLTGFGILTLVHKDLHLAAEQLVRHLHLNPASHYPMIFLDAATRVTDLQLWALAFAALTYSAIRMAEGIGLWLQRRWAEWFGLLSSGIYLPIELYEVYRGLTWPRMTVLGVNSVVVAYLLFILIKTRPKA